MVKLNSKQFAVLTTFGRDQLGYIAHVTRFISEANGNIECQSCSRMGSVFVTVTWISGNDESMRAIKATYKTQLKELTPHLVDSDLPLPLPPDLEQIHCTLTVTCYEDSPNIVRRITELLASQRVNINSLAAATYPAPFQGTPMFMMEASIDVPHKSVLRWLGASIEAWEARYGWDMTLAVNSNSDRPDNSMVLSPAPFPPSNLFQKMDIDKSSDVMADNSYRMVFN